MLATVKDAPRRYAAALRARPGPRLRSGKAGNYQKEQNRAHWTHVAESSRFSRKPSLYKTRGAPEAAAEEDAVEQALARMVRRREPITISAVAISAKVSRCYLSRHPTLGPKIRAAAHTGPGRPTPVSQQATTVEATLRHHIRGLQATHAAQLTELRDRLRRLERENAYLRGELIACGRHYDRRA